MESLYDRISKGTMTVDEITESMRYATSEGGKFYKSMENQSKTLNGQLSTLKDNAQSFLGSLTGSLSESLSSELLPMVNNLLGELQSAFETGGYEGLLSSASSMIPDLLSMMTGSLEGMMPALQRFAPKLAKNLISAFPGALKSASTLLPQLTTALFDMASSAISGLIGMLPELVPVLAEGVLGMVQAVANGTEQMVLAVFSGIEQSFHQGQTKLMGKWIDDEKIAKFDYSMEFDLDTGDAASEIETAYSIIRDALMELPLTPEQRETITSMMGADASAIEAKLIEFGIPEEEAKATAKTISDAGKEVVAAYDALDIGVDGATVAKWHAQADGSRIRMRAAAKRAGLKESDISEVMGVFDEMNGMIAGSTPNIASTIFTALTDGLADTDETKADLKEQISAYTSGLQQAADEQYAADVEALDPNASDYEAKLATYNAQYAETSQQIQDIHDNLNMLVDTYAGASTETVLAAYEEIAGVEAQVDGILAKIETANNSSAEMGQRAFELVTAGATDDEQTISTAIKFKFSEYKLEENEAEKAYNAAYTELVNSGITEGFDDALAEIEAERDQRIAEAKQSFEDDFAEILGGVADFEGVEGQMSETLGKLDLRDALSGVSDSLSGILLKNNGVDTKVANELSADVVSAIAEGLNMTPEAIAGMTVSGLQEAINMKVGELDSEISDSLGALEDGKIGATVQSALEAGLLTGTKFEATDAKNQFRSVIAAMASGAATDAAPELEAAGESATNSVISGTGDTYDAGRDKGNDYTEGYARGISEKAYLVRQAAKNLAKTAEGATAEGQESASPSKVAKRLGGDYGEGYALGIEDKIREAAAVARRMVSGVTNASSLPSTSRMAMPEISNQIVMAAQHQEPTPVMLDGEKIAEIQAGNNSRQIAFRNADDAWAKGGR